MRAGQVCPPAIPCATVANVPNTSQRRLLPGLTVADGFTRHPFDKEYGVRTSGLIAGRHLKSGHPNDRHATAYYGVAPSVFRRLLKRWKGTRPTMSIHEFTFIDIGAGMGRAVLLASQMPFQKVIGVELHSTLAGIARRNARIWRQCERNVVPMQIRCCDASEFSLPQGPCLLFLFNPFGKMVMRRLLRNLAHHLANRSIELDLLYVNNEQEAELETHRGFQRLFLGQIERSRADAIADHTILANQPDGEYASANYEDCSIWRWVG